MADLIARLAQSSFMHVLGAFLAMGSWAFFANSTHSMPAPLYAGLLQGGLSACITYFLKRFLEGLNKRLTGWPSMMMPPFIASAISFVLLMSIHSLAGTPEVLWTIILPFSVASLYAAIYNYSLCVMRRKT